MNRHPAFESVAGATNSSNWNKTLALESFFIAAHTVGATASENGNEFFQSIKSNLDAKKPKSLEDVKKLCMAAASTIPSLSYCVVFVHNSILYGVCHGGRIWLKRGDKVALLSSGDDAISGRLHDGDIIVGSSSMFTLDDKEFLNVSLCEKDIQAVAESLNSRVRTLPSTSGTCAFVLSTPCMERKPVGNFVKNSMLTGWHKVRELVRFIWFRLSLTRLTPLKIVIISLSAILFISIIVGWRMSQQNRQQKTGSTILESATHNYSEAMALIDLNPTRARELLSQAKTDLEAELQKTHAPELEQELRTEMEKINAGLSIALKRYESAAEPFFELSLIKAQAQAQKMALYENTLVLLDKTNTSFYMLDISSKASRVSGGGNQIANARDIAVHGKDVFIQTEGIIKGTTTGGALTQVVAADKAWQNPTLLYAYGGNLYLLDSNAQQIWKYIRTENGYSAIQKYLLFDTLVDLGGVSDMAIDGSIWLTKGNNLLKFTQGKEDVWRVKDLNQPLGNHLFVHTDDATEHVYICDTENKRVVVVTKDGGYVAQYAWTNDFSPDDMVASEANHVILLLSRDTIYGISLK